MKTFRLGALLLAVVAIFAVLPAAFAQDTLGASQADFDAWSAANAASAAQTAYSYGLTATVSLANLPGAELDLALTGSGAAADGGFSMDVSGTITSSGQEMPAALALLLSGDQIYLRLGDSSAEWYGGAASEVLGDVSNLAGGALPVNPADLASGDASGLMNDPALMEAMGALSQLQAGDFISLTREADNGGLAVYQLDISIQQLLTNDALAPLLGSAIMGSAAGGAGAAVPTVDPQQAAMAAQMVGNFFADAVVTVTQQVDPATQLVQQTTLSIALPLDALTAMMGAPSGSSSGPAPVLNVLLDITLSDYGTATLPAAPETFQPLSELTGAMSGMTTSP